MPSRYVMTLGCADRPGIVAAAAAGVMACGGNIVESAQFTDPPTASFSMRTCFETSSSDVGAMRATLAEHLADFAAVVRLRPEAQRRRTVLMVSKHDHCLADLLSRWARGELAIDPRAVVSNHPDCAPLAEGHGVPFVHLPVTPATRPEAEAALVALLDAEGVELVVLARYMQVLSAELCAQRVGSIINIHHSFLPSFGGARPYHQAYERGVKLIGATAHYVTADLDEGPIIEQDVVRVGHGHDVAALVRLGRDIERTVLARAVALHAEDRVALVGARTVVFGP